MFEDFEFDSSNPLKRLRNEERGLDSIQSRPQARFATQLAEIYYIRASKLEAEKERKRGIEVYSLEDLLPSLAQQVGATAHYYQLIKEKCVPVSFARSNVPLEPPKRACIATILAILIQVVVFEECGAYISISTFDRWFNSFSLHGGSPISRCWLDSKAYVAKCIAQKNRITAFGQECIWNQFNKFKELHSLGGRVSLMILRSIGYKNMQMYQNEGLDFELLFKDVCMNGLYNAYSFSKDTLLWHIWYRSFLQLLSYRVIPILSERVTAENLFMEGIKCSRYLILDLTRIINGDNTNMESALLVTELYILCGGTSGEFAAICLFVALKSSLGLHFSGEPTTRAGVELSAEVMSKLFTELIRFYTFLSPSTRHYHLLDICQSLWQSSRITRQTAMLTQSFIPQRQKRLPLVHQEDVFKHSTRTACVLVNEGTEIQSKPFSTCLLGGLRSEERLKKLVKCIQFQWKNIPMISDFFGATERNFNDDSVVSSSSSWKPISKLVWEKNITTSWCTIELPEESEGNQSFFEKFLRNATDSLVKKRVDNAMSSLSCKKQN
ncbi:hypothetical protein TraAM80_07922 [Trypanosoma rangeli]|uniref:Uncharacterized protein n=1 Tax=Trypanosoma rangeli TaxID=5698 RepID=A0A422N343_TRYRA|nr:uncharacterized protein TraAM80_07922 [Trypanosoma rangeli]RNE99906.1 hypothetical protein TraAM80_07922 [Trypanosoma rangeli]|eukprot:RNE99906.1 hypothetical protein TraAM80_07922 [Trypanosoma rangeli]